MKTRMIEVDPRRLRLLEENARFMPHEKYNRLVENVKADGALTSVPFCAFYGYFTEDDEIQIWKDDKGEEYPLLEVLSGNHRSMAAIDAGLEVITVMITEEPMSQDKRIAFQLAHNAIDGEDDPAILKRLYEKISNVDDKIYSGLDDKTLDLLEKVAPLSISESNLMFQTMGLVFLPEELESAKQALELAFKMLGKSDSTWLMRFRQYDEWLDAIEAAGTSYNVTNTATAMMIILRVFRENLGALEDGWFDADKEEAKHNNWIPLSTVLGSDKVPASVAAVIRKAVQKMMDKNEISKKNRFQALEFWAAEYLAEK